MNCTVFDCDQRSEEWAALRAGLVTGSCAPAIIAVRKRGEAGKELKVRAELRHRIVCERFTNRPLDRAFRQSDAMIHGVEIEPDAVAAYEVATSRTVWRVGFVRHNELQAGCSPDGYVGDWEGIVECKCPASTTHLEYLQANDIPDEYRGQLIHSLFLTGAEWADFVSFDPRYPEPMRLFIKRLHRSDVDMVAYELALRNFLTEVDRAVEDVSAQMAAVFA